MFRDKKRLQSSLVVELFLVCCNCHDREIIFFIEHLIRSRSSHGKLLVKTAVTTPESTWDQLDFSGNCRRPTVQLPLTGSHIHFI